MVPQGAASAVDDIVSEANASTPASAPASAGEPASHDILDELFAVIEDRKARPTPGSYTAKLLSGGDEVLKKVGEEAMEVLLAGKGQTAQRLIEESADLLYHLLVLLASRELTLDDVREELARRRR